MEFRHLLSFLAIADELHFGRAAARLHLAQPSLSQQLQRLEREVGVQLVARTSHEVRLTAAGRAFQLEAKRIIEQAGRAVRVAREAAGGHTGQIHIGFNSAARRVLPGALRRLNADHPGIHPQLWERRTGPQLAALVAGELDVAMVYGRPSAPEIMFRQVFEEPVVAVVGEHHVWAGRDHVPFRELAHQRCLSFRREQSPAMYDTIFANAERTGVRLAVADEVDDPGATEIILGTQPVVGFCSAARTTYAPSRGLVAVPLIDPTPMLTVTVAWQAVEAEPVVDAFLSALDGVVCGGVAAGGEVSIAAANRT
jgi:DNA-binding transcriptional LysR family regulator